MKMRQSGGDKVIRQVLKTTESGPGSGSEGIEGMIASHYYYETLGLKPGANLTVVKRSFRALVRKNHPDLFPDSQKADVYFSKLLEEYPG